MWKKIIGSVVIAVVVIFAGGLAYLYLRKPASAPPSSVKVEITPARLARGKYLFDDLSDCAGCHSMRDFSRFGAPVIAGGMGIGFIFPVELGLPGTVVAPNITPDVETGIGAWTDGEKIRAIREGISRDGHGLFPMMPYRFYRNMSDEDVYAVVAYMNSLAPAKNPLPRTSIQFPVFLFVKGVPQPVAGPVEVRRVSHDDRRMRGLPHATQERPAGGKHALRWRTRVSPALRRRGERQYLT
jgi:mono/diheme cytochrome c family protein